MLRDLLMAQLLALFETFVNDATDSVVKVPERVDEAGTALWEHVCESESRKALLSKLKLPAINIQLQAVIQRFINAVCMLLLEFSSCAHMHQFRMLCAM